MAMTTCELKWLKEILSSLGMTHTTPMLLNCDSQDTLHISRNLVYFEHISESSFLCPNQAYWSELSFCSWCLCLMGYSSQFCFHIWATCIYFYQGIRKTTILFFYFVSWAFEIFMLQLEGDVGIITYLVYPYYISVSFIFK